MTAHSDIGRHAYAHRLHFIRCCRVRGWDGDRAQRQRPACARTLAPLYGYAGSGGGQATVLSGIGLPTFAKAGLYKIIAWLGGGLVMRSAGPHMDRIDAGVPRVNFT